MHEDIARNMFYLSMSFHSKMYVVVCSCCANAGAEGICGQNVILSQINTFVTLIVVQAISAHRWQYSPGYTTFLWTTTVQTYRAN